MWVRAIGVVMACVFAVTIPSHGAGATCINWTFAPRKPGDTTFTRVPVTPPAGSVCPEFTYDDWAPVSLTTPQACTVKRVASYPLEPDAQGHAYIPFVIDKPRLMVVDTGGARSTLYASVVQELGLQTMDAKEASSQNAFKVGGMVGFAGETYDTVAIAPSISFGAVKFQNATFSVAPDTRRPPLAANEIAGSLGPSHLMTFDVEFDFAAHKLNLYSQNHCVGEVVYWAPWYTVVPFRLSQDGHIQIDMKLDGVPVTATLDSGAPISSIDMRTASRLFHLDKKSPGVEKYGHVGGRDDPDSAIYAYRFKSLSVTDVDIQNPKLLLVPDLINEWTNSHAPQVIFGLREMRALHLYIAYNENAIYLTTADVYCTPQDAVHKPGHGTSVCEPAGNMLRE
jgi:predicted aspartyl protease